MLTISNDLYKIIMRGKRVDSLTWLTRYFDDQIKFQAEAQGLNLTPKFH